MEGEGTAEGEGSAEGEEGTAGVGHVDRGGRGEEDKTRLYNAKLGAEDTGVVGTAGGDN